MAEQNRLSRISELTPEPVRVKPVERGQRKELPKLGKFFNVTDFEIEYNQYAN